MIIDYYSLVIGSLIFGIIIGGFSRIQRIRRYTWIFGLGTIATLVSYIFYIQDFIKNPSPEGIYVFVGMAIPFIIGSAFVAAGENIGRSFGRGR